MITAYTLIGSEGADDSSEVIRIPIYAITGAFGASWNPDRFAGILVFRRPIPLAKPAGQAAVPSGLVRSAAQRGRRAGRSGRQVLRERDAESNMNEKEPVHSVVIVGSGPAGYTAALYAARANLEPLLFAGLQPGGQLMITTDVENYPGFPDGILGPDLMPLFQRQAERFGARVEWKIVTKVDLSERPFQVWCDDERYLARTLILATGAEAKWLGLPSETNFGGYGVSACATCDGAFFRDKDVIVVGGGDTAMEEANFLTRHAKKVSVVHRRDELRASKIMQDRARKNPKIDFVWNTTLEEILGDSEPVKRVTGVKLKSTVDETVRVVEVDGVFIAIGHKPNSELFKDWLEMDELGYVKTEPWSTKTNIEGVFACGDLMDRVYRQAVTAAGTGCMAAMDAERLLEEEGH